MSLLHDVMTHAVDEGYLDVAKRRAARAAAAGVPFSGGPAAPDPAAGASGRAERRRFPARATVVAAIVLALAGALFATSAVATHRGDAAARRDRQQLVKQVEQQTAATDALQRQVDTLRSQVTSARNSALAVADRGGVLQSRIQLLEQIAGGVAVQGPGVRVVLDDAPNSGAVGSDGTGAILDSDLQRAVNGLFEAGADAVAINGERLTTQTAIREAGGAILVDYRPLSPPYTIDAIGPPTLGSTFRNGATGQLLTTEQQVYGLRFSVVDQQRLTLPSATNLVVHYAKPLDSP
jgi:uncharacterized protein YlxW (UPF0749 family)